MPRIRIPGTVRDVMDVLMGRGFEAYVVGGAVRDVLLGIEPDDWDVTTNARPGDIVSIFSRAGWKVVPKGIQYGVVSVIHPRTREEIEVATFRKEVYLEPGDRRSLVATFSDTLYDDVTRRDFTINALAADVDGNVVDYVGGLGDLERRVIRFVGDPSERIREDPLRMLRALRLSAKLGFTIEPGSLDAIRGHAHMVRHLSRERIGQEIVKAAKTPRFSSFVELLYHTGLYKYILPELGDMARTRHSNDGWHLGETVLEHTLEALRRADEAELEWVVKMAVLLHDVGKPRTARRMGGRVVFHGHEMVGATMAREILMERLRLSGEIAKKVATIIRHHSWPLSFPLGREKRMIVRAVARFGDLAPAILKHAYADTGDKRYLVAADVAEEMLRKEKPLVTGRDIMLMLGVKPGPEVGVIKRALYEIQLRYGLKSKREVIRKALELGVLGGEGPGTMEQEMQPA